MDKPSHSPLNHGVSALMEIFEKRAQKTRTLRSQLLQRHSVQRMAAEKRRRPLWSTPHPPERLESQGRAISVGLP